MVWNLHWPQFDKTALEPDLPSLPPTSQARRPPSR